MMSECVHKWSANSGRGGEPEFRPMHGESVNHVCCVNCNERTWVAEERWPQYNTTARPVVPPKPPVKPVA